MKRGDVLSKYKSSIDILIVAGTLKMYPAKRQGERYGRRQDASPGDQPVCRPAQVRSFFNEALSKEVRKEHLYETENVMRQLSGTEKNSPAAEPIHSRRRTSQPH